eukprot:206588_1
MSTSLTSVMPHICIVITLIVIHLLIHAFITTDVSDVKPTVSDAINHDTNIETCGNSKNSWKQISEIAEEHDSISPEIIFGKIPTNIKGYVYKNGAGRIKLNNNLFYTHWFDGDGMATLLQFNGNGQLPLFTSKYIQTNRFITQGNETSYFKIRGAWTEATYWYNNILSQPTNPSNTNILYFNNKLFSMCEAGTPI